MYVGVAVPILNKILKALDYSDLANVVDALNFLYKFLDERSPEFAEVYSRAVEKGVKPALKYLRTVLNKIVKLCKRHKILISHLGKLAVKGVVSTSTKVAMKFGAGKAASQTVKTVLKFTTVTGMVADVAQAGLEATGHKQIGQNVGKWGNIGTGAMAGAAVAGPVGAPIGALAGFGTWLIGEAAGQAVEHMLS